MARMVNLGLQIRLSPEVSEQEVLSAVRKLQTDLERFDVSVEPAPSGMHASPKNAPNVYGLTLSVFPLVLPRLVDFLEAWALDDDRRALTLELDVDGRIVTMQLPSRQSGVIMLDQLLASAVA